MCRSLSSEKGMVLITVLSIIIIVTVIALMLCHDLISDQHESFNAFQAGVSRSDAMIGVRHGFMMLKQRNVSCVRSDVNMSDVVDPSSKLWFSTSICHDNHVDYFIESLGDDSCAVLNGVRGVKYWRVISRGMKTAVAAGTIAITDLHPSKCSGELFQLKQAVQSYYFL